jgi:hypothetical protein
MNSVLVLDLQHTVELKSDLIVCVRSLQQSDQARVQSQCSLVRQQGEAAVCLLSVPSCSSPPK